MLTENVLTLAVDSLLVVLSYMKHEKVIRKQMLLTEFLTNQNLSLGIGPSIRLFWLASGVKYLYDSYVS
jgi:hypothetical protein